MEILQYATSTASPTTLYLQQDRQLQSPILNAMKIIFCSNMYTLYDTTKEWISS